ncbi:hypothetical protein STEG23_006871 [Scotinomys teguina]
MARKAGQWEEEEVAQSHEEEERHQPARRRKCRVTAVVNEMTFLISISELTVIGQPLYFGSQSKTATYLKSSTVRALTFHRWAKEESSQLSGNRLWSGGGAGDNGCEKLRSRQGIPLSKQRLSVVGQLVDKFYMDLIVFLKPVASGLALDGIKVPNEHETASEKKRLHNLG